MRTSSSSGSRESGALGQASRKMPEDVPRIPFWIKGVLKILNI